MKHSSFQLNIASKGFTLIEMLVSVGVISLVAIILTQVFFSTGRSNSKVSIENDVKQSGDYALSIMDRMIRSARAVTSVCDGSTASSITITNFDNGSTTFSCLTDGLVTRIASASGQTQYLTGTNVTLGSDCSSALQFTCISSANVPARVQISFSLAQKGTPQTSYESASIQFASSVSLRNNE